jgi:hypothetical protein
MWPASAMLHAGYMGLPVTPLGKLRPDALLRLLPDRPGH